MPVVPLSELTTDAFQRRYGVPAINIVNDLTLEGVLAAAVESRSPLIVQTSVKTVRSIGSGVLKAMWDAMTADVERARHVAPRPLSRARGDHRVPRAGLELRALRCLAPARRGEPAPDDRGRRRGPPSRRPRGGRDRVDHRRRGRGRLRRRGRTPVARRRPRLPRSHEGRRVRAGHRQRARVVQAGSGPRLPARLGHRGRATDPDRAARRQRPERRAVPRPDRAGAAPRSTSPRRSRRPT